jgi:hypothetical protein
MSFKRKIVPIFLKLVLLLKVAVLTFPCYAIGSNECSSLLSSLTIQRKLDVKEMSQEIISVENKFQTLAEQLSVLYFSGSMNKLQEILKCLSRDQKIFSYLSPNLQSEIWKESIKNLKHLGTKANILSNLYQNSGALRFTLGHEYISSDRSKAYYHRGEKSIYMDLTKIPTHEWPIIFTHELIHAIDDEFLKDISTYGDSHLLGVIQRIAISCNLNPKTILTLEEESSLRTWVLASLGRGLFAEVRAWAVTMSIYLEGRKNNSVKEISWLEEILKKKNVNESLIDFSFRYFDPLFVSSYHDWFSIPCFKQMLDSIRNDLRSKKIHIAIDPKITSLL